MPNPTPEQLASYSSHVLDMAFAAARRALLSCDSSKKPVFATAALASLRHVAKLMDAATGGDSDAQRELGRLVRESEENAQILAAANAAANLMGGRTGGERG